MRGLSDPVRIVDASGVIVSGANPLPVAVSDATPLPVDAVGASEGYDYEDGVYTFSTAADNTLLTFAADVLLDCVFIQNESTAETVAILKLGDTSIARMALEGKRGGTYCPPFGPRQVAAGTVLKVNLSGANAHSATVLYRLA